MLPLLALSLVAAAGTPRADDLLPVGGRLSWLSADGLDLLADVWAELSAVDASEAGLWLAVDSRLSVEDTTSNLDFAVRDLEYTLEAGWRGAARGRAPRWGFLAGQRGLSSIDRSAHRWIRYVGISVGSPEYDLAAGPAPSLRRLDWRLALGPVLDDRGTGADGWIRGGARLRPLLRSRGRDLALELTVEGLASDGRLRSDVAFGPSVALPLAAAHELRLFARYQRSRDPLGIGLDTWMAGLQFAGETRRGRRGAPGLLNGTLRFGGGSEHRSAAQMALRLASPPWGDGWRVVLHTDANVLTGREADQAYWRYHLGLQRPLGAVQVGGYLYHRSNHRLAEFSPRFTSINVLELGVESPQWDTPGPSRHPTPGRWDWRLRIGALLNSSYGEQRRGNVRAGLRLRLPRGGFDGQPYVQVDGDRGDVQRDRLALGWITPADVDLRLEYRRDEQYFGPDATAVLATAGVGF